MAQGYQGAIPLYLRNDARVSEFPYILADAGVYHEDMARITKRLEDGFSRREGYAIKAEGSGGKGPERQTWKLTMTFESIEGCQHAWNVLTGD